MNSAANEGAVSGAATSSSTSSGLCPPRMDVKTSAANSSSSVIAPLASVICPPSSQPSLLPQSVAFNRLLQPTAVAASAAAAVNAFFPGVSSSQLAGLGPVKDSHKSLFINTAGRPNVPTMLSPAMGLPTGVSAHNASSVAGGTTPNAIDPQPLSNAANQRLKVEDALSYLDLVKVQFSNRPQVYSDFLDIMKDFKSQTIDTPGVIRRVSKLFRGRPALIVGFNTFLPPGFKVQVDGNRIVICEPNGETQIIADEENDDPPPRQGQVLSPSSVSANNGHAPPMNPGAASNVRPAIEFNHAISYVNKIKARFHHKPDVYKQFLEILHSYQKEQRDLKYGGPGHKPTLTESEVYASVSKLFENEPDLLREFSQFLPDACGFLPHLNSSSAGGTGKDTKTPPRTMTVKEEPRPPVVAVSPGPLSKVAGSPQKRPAPSPKGDLLGPPKKTKNPPVIAYDIDMAEACKYGTMEEFQFFDKVRKAFKCDEVYDNFLRCLVLYNQHLISKSELIELLLPFLGKHPELMKWLKDFLGCNDRQGYVDGAAAKSGDQEGISSDLAMEIDYASCKRHGVSYRALPASYKRPTCSGRTPVCTEVLNDTWVSFPSWSSEDTSFVSSKKSQYEEFIYRTEDERFELDIVIEVNKSALQTLEFVQRKMSRMTTDEANKFRLDDSLASRSPALMQRAIRRIYGDKTADIITGLKRNPAVAVPLVIKRLKTKDEEWREAQKGFNRIWRDQNEKYHLKSLDHQGITFKQNDLKQLRSKVLINQIETLYDERHARMEEGGPEDIGPHMTISYPTDKSIFYDVADLLIHHVKRQTSIHKDEKARIKRILRRVLPQLFALEQEVMSDEEDEPSGEEKGTDSEADATDGPRPIRRSARALPQPDKEVKKPAPVPRPTNEPTARASYSLMLTSNAWFVFLRLHHLLCERMGRLKRRAQQLTEEDEADSRQRSASDHVTPAEALKFLPKQSVRPSQYYAQLISQVKNLLDNQIESGPFEDNIRAMFTTDAYVAFTMDKLITTMVRQLQLMVSDELNQQVYGLYEKHRTLGGAGGSLYAPAGNRAEFEDAYQAAAELLLVNQNCFKIHFINEAMSVTFELIDTDTDDEEDDSRAGWSAYVQAYLQLAPDTDPEKEQRLLRKLEAKPLLLMRNIRQSKAHLSKANCDAKKVTTKNLTEKSEEKNEDEGGKATTSENIDEDGLRERALAERLVDESLQVRIDDRRHRMRFVASTGDLLLRRGAPQLARKKHADIVQMRKKRFTEWLQRRKLGGDEKATDRWFIGPDATTQARSSKETASHSNDFPYLTSTRYRTTTRSASD